MDEFCGANTPRGVKGQEQQTGNDFEVHPAGTAERLRQLGIIGTRAAEILEGLAQDTKDSESINGEWPDDPEACAAQIDYDEWTATAGYLRALCAPTAAAPAPELKPDDLPDEAFTVQVYPWPGDEGDQ